MPRYTKNDGAKGYRKKYKSVNHEDAATILENLTPLQFSQLQEISKHGMGLHTMFRELLSEYPKKKVKPSSFQKYANAQSPQEIVHALRAEKEAHSDHTSETHMGGGIRDVHNALGSWAYDVSNVDNMSWALDQLDPKTLTKSDLGCQVQQNHPSQTDDDWMLGVLIELDRLHKNDWKMELPKEEGREHDKHKHRVPYVPHENPVIESGNQIMGAMGWIGGILGSTVDFLSDFDTTDNR